MTTQPANNRSRAIAKILVMRVALALFTLAVAVAASEFAFRGYYNNQIEGVPDEGQWPLLAFPYLALTYHSGSIGLFTDLEFTIASILSFGLLIVIGLCTMRVPTGRYKLSAILIAGIVLAGGLYRAYEHPPGGCIPSWMFDALAMELYKEPAVMVPAAVLLALGAFAGAFPFYNVTPKSHGFEVVLPADAAVASRPRPGKSP